VEVRVVAFGRGRVPGGVKAKEGLEEGVVDDDVDVVVDLDLLVLLPLFFCIFLNELIMNLLAP
jgi:hypothetical protein